MTDHRRVRLAQFRSPRGNRIIGRADTVPGVAMISTFEIVDAEAPTPIWEGGTTMNWDGQTPRLDTRRRPVFVDERGYYCSLEDCTEEPNIREDIFTINEQPTRSGRARYVRYRAPNGLLIAASADTMAVTTHIAAFAIVGESETPEAIYDGYTDHGDTTAAVLDDEGRDVYLDECGNEWALADCTMEHDEPDDSQRLYYEHIHTGHTRGPHPGCERCQRAQVRFHAVSNAPLDESGGT